MTGHRPWVNEPETSDAAVREATGRGWDEWCDLVEAWPGHVEGHGAIATHLEVAHGVDGWWAQTITVGYERIAGRRAPYQQPDGTFTASVSRTVDIEAGVLRARLLDDNERADLFGGLHTELRSKPASKTVRLSVGPGVAQLALDGRPNGRTKVVVQHEKLPSARDVDEWKAYWSGWFDTLGAVIT